jgi:hypothetical protein
LVRCVIIVPQIFVGLVYLRFQKRTKHNLFFIKVKYG